MTTVYTCSTNRRDALREDQCTASARFVAFVDTPSPEESVWDQYPATSIFRSARRNARMHKVLSHQFIASDVSIWMDSNVSLKIPANELVERYLQTADIAVFNHRTRKCTYDEAARCIELGLDAKHLIEDQVRHLRESAFPIDHGLAETTVVIRRHTQQIRRFNDSWWSEICRYSVRDQLSFMHAALKTETKVYFIEPTKYLNPAFSISNRPAGPEPTTEP